MTIDKQLIERLAKEAGVTEPEWKRNNPLARQSFVSAKWKSPTHTSLTKHHKQQADGDGNTG